MRYPLSRNKSFAERLIHEITEDGRLWQRTAVSCGHMTRGSYKTSSGAAILLLSFLQL